MSTITKKSLEISYGGNTYVYQPPTDPTGTQAGVPADAKETGDALSALDTGKVDKENGKRLITDAEGSKLSGFAEPSTETASKFLMSKGDGTTQWTEKEAIPVEFKTAILALAQNVAYATDQGMDVYNDLLDSLYDKWPITNTLTHCTSSNSAAESEKNASYSATITADENYMLSGATISVVMGGVDITSTAYSNGVIAIPAVTGFLNITVTAVVDPTQSCVLDGLVAYWDGIKNTASGHDSSATTWEDLVGNYDLVANGSSWSWNNDSLQLTGATDGSGFKRDSLWEFSENATIEIVLAPVGSSTMSVATFDRANEPLSAGGSLYNVRRFNIFSDNTVNFKGQGSTSYINPESALSDIRKLVSVYSGFNSSKIFINGTKKTTQDGYTHSLSFAGDEQMRVGCENFNTGSPTTKYPFNGKIYAIRVYNRALTDEEIAHNLAYDNNRFSLGLTL